MADIPQCHRDMPICNDDKAETDKITPTESRTAGIVIDMGGSSENNVSNLLLVERTIETIGMGLFQWKLTVTCAFGFIVDQVSRSDEFMLRI